MFTIEIPELEYELITVATDEVRVGEDVVNKNGALVTVAEVKRGPKWVTVLSADGVIWRQERGTSDAFVKVRRATEASRQARSKADLVQFINDDLRKKAAKHERGHRTKSAMAKLQSDVDAGYVLRYDRIENLLAAQAEDQIRDAYFHQLTGVLAQDPATDLEAWTKAYKEQISKRLIQRLNGLSRSTSVVSNAMEDALNGATADFVRDLFWY